MVIYEYIVIVFDLSEKYKGKYVQKRVEEAFFFCRSPFDEYLPETGI